MTRTPFIVLVGACMGAAGCMPMEQASLVYSSKHQFGIGVAAGTADSPGLDVAIGYKGLDTAYVPVAVAKNCKAQGTTNCGTINYDLKPVVGTSTESGLSERNERELADVMEKIDDKDAKLRAQSRIVSAGTQILDQIANLQNDVTQRNALLARDQAPAPAVASADGAAAPASAPLNEQERSDLALLNARI